MLDNLSTQFKILLLVLILICAAGCYGYKYYNSMKEKLNIVTKNLVSLQEENCKLAETLIPKPEEEEKSEK